MKTATLPSLRVEPEFRDQLEGVLREGETVSAFIESSVREALRRRQLDSEFHARAVASAERVQQGLERTYTLDEVEANLRSLVDQARKTRTKARSA